MKNILKTAIVGAGNMGSGIAQKIATEGINVVMLDMTEENVTRGLNTIKNLLGQAVERNIFSEDKVNEILSCISLSTKYEDLADCDLVIEAVFENLDVKKEVFGKLDKVCQKKTILATNTSSYYVKDVAAATQRPDQVVGLHYFFHPAKNRLVEVVPTEWTSEDCRRKVWVFNEMIGKTPIHSKDTPGFVVNRFFVPWVNESVRLLEEDVANIATIDAAAIEAFNIGMGPFELMNVTGVPISFHAATTLGNELGELYRPCARLKNKVDTGENWPLEGEIDRSRFEEVTRRLKGVTYLIAGTLVDEGVSSMEDTDIGARVGLRWSVGPFELMNRDGVTEAQKMIETIANRYSHALPKCVMQQEGRDFVFEWVRLKKEGDCATFTFDRPDAMNALNVQVMNQLREKFDEAEKDAQIKTIVIEGTGKAFVAGADIKFFIKNMKLGDIDSIVSFTQSGQRLYQDIDNSSKFVIVKLDGLSLGGGSELLLCADAVLATDKGSMGFPETGIGIYPGLGGTQRLPKKIGKALAKWMIYSGQVLSAVQAKELGLIQKIVKPAELDETLKEMANNPELYCNQSQDIPNSYQSLSEFFEKYSVENFLEGEVETDDPILAKIAKKISFKAPIALAVSEELIDGGFEKSLDEGIIMEIAKIKDIFGSKDALEGLSSLGRKRPEWVNA